MLDRPYTGPTKLILAFDIGTIYSCVSYCILVPHRVPKVLAVARFPAQGVARADNKVPSLLYYDKSGVVRAAGAEVYEQEVIETALAEGWTKAEWWKLHLCATHLSSFTNDVPPLPPGKSAVDVLTDFIRYLFDCCKSYIQKCHSPSTWSSVEHSVEYIFTYPGGWDEQQHLYRQAIERAGLVPSTYGGQPRVYMLTEGGAGLHFFIAQFLSRETADSATPQGSVIIDAGGGIIGLSMFSVTVTPNLISWAEIAPAECRLQGSVFVTCRAKALLERKLEGWEHSSAEDISRFTREFDQTTKLVIENNRQPAYIRIAGRDTHSQRHSVTSGQLKLSGDEVTGLFGDSVDAIIDTFEQQKKFSAMPITTAFLVGGLSTSDWVWSQLQSYFLARKIAVYRPESHITKVAAKGAIWYAAMVQSDPSLATCYSSRLTSSHIICENRLGLPCTTYGVGGALPVKEIDKDPAYRKTTLRDCVSRISARLHMLAKKCDPREWLSTMERDLAGIDRSAVCHVPCYPGCLSTPKWVDRNRSELSVTSSLTICAGESEKDTVALPDFCVLKKSEGSD